MDNAATHIGGEASIVEDLLWNVEVDERPLHTMILLLPAELNPIELIFHNMERDKELAKLRCRQ